MEEARAAARKLAYAALERGDPTGWFEELYASAGRATGRVPWADLEPNPNVVAWLERRNIRGEGLRALVAGSGLGDDAEEIARWGYRVTAFDISPTATAWCRERFPDSVVEYVTADLLSPLAAWRGAFDLVLEVFTLQTLPPEPRAEGIERLSELPAPGGTLLVYCRGREPDDDLGAMPWPLTLDELDGFERHGLREVRFEDFIDTDGVRRFRVEYQR